MLPDPASRLEGSRRCWKEEGRCPTGPTSGSGEALPRRGARGWQSSHAGTVDLVLHELGGEGVLGSGSRVLVIRMVRERVGRD